MCHVGYCPVIEFHCFESKCGAWGNFVGDTNKNLPVHLHLYFSFFFLFCAGINTVSHLLEHYLKQLII